MFRRKNLVSIFEGGGLKRGQGRGGKTPPMPIDAFFRSLAAEQQYRAIGVVLSGTGSDGTLGIEAIKGEGGITFAQDERSAKYFGMPGSAIAVGAIDKVLSPVQIARELVRIARHPLLEPTREVKHQVKAAADTANLERALSESSKELITLFRLLRARTGVDFCFYKHSTLKRRIIRRMILHKVDQI